MDRLELAQRRYRQLVPSDVFDPSKAPWPYALPTHDVSAWIEDYVIPAAEELWARPRFRELAAWPQRHLAPGSAAPERKDVEAVADALVAAAAALLKLASRPAVASRLEAACPPVPVAVREEVQIASDAPAPAVLSREVRLVSELPALRGQVEEISRRPWKDLLSVADYFGPVADMDGNPPAWVTDAPAATGGILPAKGRRPARPRSSIRPAQASLHPLFNRRLVPLGDLVVRCMMARVRAYLDSIARFRACVTAALRASSGRRPIEATAEQGTWDHLRERVSALQQSCAAADALARREGATALTQVYLTFRPGAEAQWLGLPNALVARGDAWLKAQLVVRRDLQTLERLAAALGEMRTLYRDHPPGESAFDQAVATGGLVLCEDPPLIYWDGRLLPVDWNTHRADWDFWLQLAKKARCGLSVGLEDLYGDGSVPSSRLYSRKNRADALIRDTAPDLAGLIIQGPEPRSYRLDLDPGRVHVFPRRYRAES